MPAHNWGQSTSSKKQTTEGTPRKANLHVSQTWFHMSLKAQMSVWLRFDFSVPQSKELTVASITLGIGRSAQPPWSQMWVPGVQSVWASWGLSLLSYPLTGWGRFHLSQMHRMNRPKPKSYLMLVDAYWYWTGGRTKRQHVDWKAKGRKKFSRRRQELYAGPSVSREGEKSSVAGWVFLLIISLGAVGERRRGNWERQRNAWWWEVPLQHMYALCRRNSWN